MLHNRNIIKFHGALYAQTCGLGDGCAVLTDKDVAVILSKQYFNRGKTTVEGLRDKWVVSSLFILTKVYPSMPELGVSPGKTGKTFSTGLPLVIDRDVHSISEQVGGIVPTFLTLDGQNRVVKLRRTTPRTLYPAYVGNLIFKEVSEATYRHRQEIESACQALAEHTTAPSGGTRRRVLHYIEKGLILPDEVSGLVRSVADKKVTL